MAPAPSCTYSILHERHADACSAARARPVDDLPAVHLGRVHGAGHCAGWREFWSATRTTQACCRWCAGSLIWLPARRLRHRDPRPPPPRLRLDRGDAQRLGVGRKWRAGGVGCRQLRDPVRRPGGARGSLGLSLERRTLLCFAMASGFALINHGVEANRMLGNRPIMPPTLAHAFALFSAAAMVNRRWNAAFA